MTIKKMIKLLLNGMVCNVLETLDHCIFRCERIQDCGSELLVILSNLLDRPVTEKEILCLCFNSRKNSTLKVSLWFAVKATFEIFENKILDRKILWKKIIEDIGWLIDMQVLIGSTNDLRRLENILQSKI